MSKYFRVTIGTRLDSTFSIKYSTISNSSTYDHTADIYNPTSETYSTATNISYSQLTDNGGAIVRTDDDVYKLTIVDQNGYCNNCISEEFGTIPVISNPPSTSNIYIYLYDSGQSSNGYVSSFPIYYQKWSEYNYGNNTGRTHGVRNDSDQDVYIRLMAKTYINGTLTPDAIAVKLYEQSNPIGNNNTIYIGSYFGGTNIYPSSTISYNNPAYSYNGVWQLGKNGGIIIFGIDTAVYSQASQTNSISYTLAYSVSGAVNGTQTEITSYVT